MVRNAGYVLFCKLLRQQCGEPCSLCSVLQVVGELVW